VRYVVDERDCVRFWHVSDENRLSQDFRWPAVMRSPITTLGPPVLQERLTTLFSAVRTSGEPRMQEFNSAVFVGEYRRIYAQPVPGRSGWVDLTLFAVPAESVIEKAASATMT
jgi:hypothetical protein